MVNNKQVNIWRGDSIPPTIYHVWIFNNTRMLLYNGSEWVVFIDDLATVQKINQLTARVDAIEIQVDNLENKTVNSIPIKNNPVLTGDNINLNKSGTYVTSTNKVSDSIIKLDTLLTTQIIE